jgi:hypothetical protein
MHYSPHQAIIEADNTAPMESSIGEAAAFGGGF